MAKTRNATIVSSDRADDADRKRKLASIELSRKVQHAIDGIKRSFTSYVKDFSALSVTREDLAPKFMKACGMWQSETAGTFVDFVRFLIPDVGNTRTEYRSHRAYQAADYLRRLMGNSTARRRGPMSAAERATVAATPGDAVATLMAALMTIIPEKEQEKVWGAMRERLHWTDRQVSRLQTQVENTDPLVQIRAKIANLRLTFPAIGDREEKIAA